MSQNRNFLRLQLSTFFIKHLIFINPTIIKVWFYIEFCPPLKVTQWVKLNEWMAKWIISWCTSLPRECVEKKKKRNFNKQEKKNLSSFFRRSKKEKLIMVHRWQWYFCRQKKISIPTLAFCWADFKRSITKKIIYNCFIGQFRSCVNKSFWKKMWTCLVISSSFG